MRTLSRPGTFAIARSSQQSGPLAWRARLPRGALWRRWGLPGCVRRRRETYVSRAFERALGPLWGRSPLRAAGFTGPPPGPRVISRGFLFRQLDIFNPKGRISTPDPAMVTSSRAGTSANLELC